MKKKSINHAAFFNPRVLLAFFLCVAGILTALVGLGTLPNALAQVNGSKQNQASGQAISGLEVVSSYRNDVSRPLRDVPVVWPPNPKESEREANPNPKIPHRHVNRPDPVVQRSFLSRLLAPNGGMPGTILNFDGIPFPGVVCNCAPPDTDGAVGRTQYVQIVNEGFQVFDKETGASVLGPVAISALWNGFGGECENHGDGDPIVLYDHLANRWLVSQFAGEDIATDECIAISTSSDATGSYNRYGFHLGSNFFDYPKLGVWPDAYYMSMNIFNSAGTTYLGPQPFAFDRASMLAGQPATFITTGITNGSSEPPYLPSDLDGAVLPPAGGPNSFIGWPSSSAYKIYHFHVDFTTPANSTFTLFASPSAAGFIEICPSTRSCIPQLGTSSGLDAIGDRLMARAAYRNFGDHESVVTNYTVDAGSGVAGVRWIELRDVTNGPATVFQESTYSPDSTSRWMGSVAMDGHGNLAVGFSASSSAIHPQVRYAGRLATDPINTLPQGEATLFAGAGSEIGSSNRWGDYSAMAVDPVDDCTFWYTNEYYSTTSSFNWRTRIGKFRFADCVPMSPPPEPQVSIYETADDSMVQAGTQIGFEVSLQNTGDAIATGLTFTNNLPAGPGINWSLDSGGSDVGWSVMGSPPNESLVYSPTTLDVGATVHAHVISATTTASDGLYLNTAFFDTDNDGSGSASDSVVVLAPVCTLSEVFDDITTLTPANWSMQNNSQPLGGTGWFQGDTAVFSAHSGAPNSYIAANFSNGSGTATISNWLLTPPFTLDDGAIMTFWTRTVDTPSFPDRLQLRMSTNGFSTDVGSSATSVGDFTTLLLDINPTYTTSGYPNTWTQFTVMLTGVPTATTGRLAFRYFVESGGPNGANSDYIGIDDVDFNCSMPTPTPTPTPPAADFNGDGKPDYVLYNATTRRTAIWYLNNNAYVSGAFGPTLPASWSLVDVDDFNRDGKPDYVLYNATTRRTAIWYLNNNAYVGGAFGPTLPASWSLVDVDDFNRDGKPDYVLYNATTRRTAIWYLNNNAYISGAFGPTLPSNWGVAGVGDFNRNGKPDYLLFNLGTRQSAIWYLNNNAYVSGAFGPTILGGYVLTGTADFDRDGKADYALFNPSTHRTAIWYLDNNTYLSAAFGPTLPPAWNLVRP